MPAPRGAVPAQNNGVVMAFAALALLMLIALCLALLRAVTRLHRENTGSAA